MDSNAASDSTPEYETVPAVRRKTSVLWWSLFWVLLLANLVAAWHLWAREPDVLRETISSPPDAAEVAARDRLQADNAQLEVVAIELEGLLGQRCPVDDVANPLDVSALEAERDRIRNAIGSPRVLDPAHGAGTNTQPPTESPGLPSPLSRDALLQRLKSATVLIIAPIGNDDYATGSGFFIAPDKVVTNRHVVEKSIEGRVLMTNTELGHLREGQVISLSRDSGISHPDFAVIKLPTGAASTTLAITDQYTALTPVRAAGYPGLSMRNDANFAALINGDTTAAPELIVNSGDIQSVQPGRAGSELLLNSTDILTGNSGGPLVDDCGRVVGVNTFIAVEQEQAAKLSYALSSKELIAFLKESGERYALDSARCAER